MDTGSPGCGQSRIADVERWDNAVLRLLRTSVGILLQTPVVGADMSLKIDPSQFEGDDIGEKRATLHMGHEEAVEHVREAFTQEGFGVATEFSASEMLNEKVDAGRDPYHVLGACNPNMADRALGASEKRIGALFPCNVVIWQEEPGVQTVYHVSIMKVARLTGMAPDDETMADIIEDTGDLVDAAWANLNAAE
jgi:uncharacterized protein (DUF302 family)